MWEVIWSFLGTRPFSLIVRLVQYLSSLKIYGSHFLKDIRSNSELLPGTLYQAYPDSARQENAGKLLTGKR